MARLPTPGQDDGTWGDILNSFLKTEHNPDGTQKPLAQSTIIDLENDLAAKADSADLAGMLTAANNLSDVEDPAEALTNLGAEPAIPSGTFVPSAGEATKTGDLTLTDGVIIKSDAVFDVRAYPGYDPIAVDNSAAIQAAIDAANAAVGGWGHMAIADVLLPPGRDTGATGLTLPGNVHLTGRGSRLTATAAGPVLTVNGNHNRVSQIQFQGGGGAVGANGIVISSGARWNVIDFCRFDGMSGRAILFDTGSISNEAKSIFAQNCVLTTAGLAAHTGVVDMKGTDNWFHHSEITASRSSLSSASAYADALVITGANSFVEDVQAEISDLGVYLDASDLHMMNVRADLNRGHGFHIAGGSGTIVGCEALNNGQDADDTYDGFHSAAGNFVISNCMAVSNTANRHKFGLNDQQNSFSNANRVWGFTSIGQAGVAIFTPAFAGARIAVMSGPPFPVTVAATTFNCQQPGEPTSFFAMKNTTPVTFTNFTGGIGGHRISILGDGFTTIPHGTSFFNAGNASLLLATNTITSYVWNNGVWYQDGATRGISATQLAPGAASQNAQAGMPNVSGRYFSFPVANTSSQALFNGTIWAMRFEVAAALTLTRIGIEITAAATSSTVRLGIYNSDGNVPTTVLLDTGVSGASIDPATTTGFLEYTISQALAPGVYFLAVVSQGGAPSVRAGSTLSSYAAGHVTALTMSQNVMGALTMSGVAGALPAFVVGSISVICPRVLVKV